MSPWAKLHRKLVRVWLERHRRGEVDRTVRAVFVGDYVGDQVILEGIYERRLLELLMSTFLPDGIGGTCIDVGANIGNHAAFFLRHASRVIAFEPNPAVRRLLDVNVHGLAVEVVGVGLSSAAGTLHFREDPGNCGASMIVDRAEDASSTIEVVTLDRWLGDRPDHPIRFVKIDVEGHEWDVLQGARDVLRRDHPVLALEGHYGREPAKGEAVQRLLSELGYDGFYHLVPRSGAARRLERSGVRLGRGPIGQLAALAFGRDRTFERTGTIAGRQHSLLVARREPVSATRAGAPCAPGARAP